MRQNPSFTLASEEGVKRLIREHPWMTIVSATDAAGLVASHYPVLLDEEADGIVLSSLHSRTATRVYVKAILQGRSEAQLSAEEIAALRDAGLTI